MGDWCGARVRTVEPIPIRVIGCGGSGVEVGGGSAGGGYTTWE